MEATMTDRHEVFLGDTLCKRKLMPNGEERISITIGDTKISITRAPTWKLAEQVPLPWQEAHLHKGLTETYQLVSGWIGIIWFEGSVHQTILREPGEVRVFKPMVPHLVILGPAAEIITSSFGIPVPNPDKKGNDWWDVEAGFRINISREFDLVEHKIRHILF